MLGPLAASRTGLTEAELLDLLGDGARRPLSQLQLAAGSLIGDFGGRLRLSFDQVQAAAQRRYLADAPDVHRRLAALFTADPCSPRAIEELPWQLLAAGDAEQLRALLVDPAFIEAAYDTRREPAGAPLGPPRGDLVVPRGHRVRAVRRHAAHPRDVDRDADRGPVRRRGGGARAAPRGRRRAP